MDDGTAEPDFCIVRGSVAATADAQDETDFVYEEDLLRDPYSPKRWLQYIAHARGRAAEHDAATVAAVLGAGAKHSLICERALRLLPRSYKLWMHYLGVRTERVGRLLQLYRDRPQEHTAQTAALLAQELANTNDVFERSLLTMHKMPRVWLDYAAFLMRQRRLTATRTTLNRALASLPPAQHDRVWSLYLRFASATEPVVPRLAADIWARYWRVAADRSDAKTASRYLALLLRCAFYDDAAALLVQLAQNEPPRLIGDAGASAGRDGGGDGDGEITPGRYWQRLCEIVCAHGASIRHTPVEAVLRGAVAKAMAKSHLGLLQQQQQQQQQRKDQKTPIHTTGILWNALATWHIRNGRFDCARDVYEEAIHSVCTIRDFSLVFDALAKMEESIIGVELERRARKKPKKNAPEPADLDLDMRLARFEHLIQARPFLLSAVRLRQQPNNVAVWMERVRLVEGKGDAVQVVATFEEALARISPRRLKGSLATLWTAYASYCAASVSLDEARAVFRRAVQAEFAGDDDLADVWIAFAEMEMRHATSTAALDVLAEALVPPSPGRRKQEGAGAGEGPAAQNALYKNAKLWNYYLDLEEARGFPAAIRAAYDRVMQLGIATPQTVINYAVFLESLQPPAVEDAFRVYERGVAAFGYPVAFEIWNVYLPKYVAHHAPRGNLEMIRDLFEQALAGCPKNLSLSMYVQYAGVEEQHGLTRNALRILERGAHSVVEDRRIELFELLLSKTLVSLGVSALRAVYEDAIATLTSLDDLASMSSQYAALETSLGEVERARTIYTHAASSTDPRLQPALWMAWQEFETKHGTEATFRDMLRIKRSVSARFASLMPFVPAQQNAPATDQPLEQQNDEEINLE